MQITIAATPKMELSNLNGVSVPVRLWTGHTRGGVAVEAIVVTVMPISAEDFERFKSELAPFQTPKTWLMDVGRFLRRGGN